MVAIEYLSYSSISMLLDCPEQWRRKYIERQPVPSAPALIFGSAFHQTVERIVGYSSLWNEGPEPDLLKTWHEVWASKVTNEGHLVDWGADTPAQHYNEGVRIFKVPEVQQLLADLIPQRNETGEPTIELKCTLSVPGVPVPVIGYIDIITDDGIPGDFKTSAKSWSAAKAEDELQPLFYLAALNQMGRLVPGWKFRHYVVTKTKTPKVQRIESAHSPDKVFWLFELIQRAWSLIEAEVYPFGPSSWRCSPRFCPFWTDCRGKTFG